MVQTQHMQIWTYIPCPAIMYKSISRAFLVLLCVPLYPLAPQFLQPPNPVSSNSSMSLIPCTSFPRCCPIGCLTVSTLAASLVNSFHLCHPQTLLFIHVLSWSAHTPLGSLLRCFLCPGLSLCTSHAHLSILPALKPLAL